MEAKFWGVIVFLLTVAVAATPASGGDSYFVVTSTEKGHAAHMTVDPDGIMSEQQDMQLDFSFLYDYYPDNATSFGNGIGDFNNDTQLDYITAMGSLYGAIFIFSGPDFDFGIPVKDLPGSSSPADIAVADFDGDEKRNLDFVLNFKNTPHCAIYLGDGKFGFEEIMLDNTTPTYSTGVDAADFNNDGHIDFVIGPGFSQPFRVYLNNGDGTFGEADGLQHNFPYPKQFFGFSGIAAGDFIEDPGGFADLVVSGMATLDIYAGDGYGAFTYAGSYTVPAEIMPMLWSPLDNGDFNNDGHQDLLLADIGGIPEGVALLLGDGNGSFTLSGDAIGTGGPDGKFRALTALPFQNNKEPVAQLTPETNTVTVGETVNFDASASSDEDGTIDSYHWDYGEGVELLAGSDTGGDSGEAQSSHVYYDSGQYTVTLTVTDSQGATATVQAEVNVEPLKVGVYFSRGRLNLESKGKWITATIRAPAGYDARGIDAENLYLVVSDDIAPIPAHQVYLDKGYRKHHKKKYRSHRIRNLKAKFDRQALIGALGDFTGITSLKVTGEISTGKARLEFAGKGNIKAFVNKKKKSGRSYNWKQVLSFFSKGKSK